jgi:hypothetical protein
MIIVLHGEFSKLIVRVLLKVLENEKLREQLQSFLTQYEVRDKHFEQQIQVKEAEKLAAEEKQAKVSTVDCKAPFCQCSFVQMTIFVLQAENRCREALREAEQYRAKAEEHTLKVS